MYHMHIDLHIINTCTHIYMYIDIEAYILIDNI